MNFSNDEIIQLWRVLADHKVRYITVGDFAGVFHGARYHTGILDLWVDDTLENRERLADAFTSLFGEDYSSFKTLEFIPGWTSFRFMSGFEISIMTSIAGFGRERFDECFREAPIVDIHNVPVRFLGYDHLITSKQASGRPQDVLNIEELRRANKQD